MAPITPATIWHNDEFTGYIRGSEIDLANLCKVAEIAFHKELPMMDVLETCFRRTNSVDAPWTAIPMSDEKATVKPELLRARSTSVGDVIMIGKHNELNAAYVVANCGFEKLTLGKGILK
jgi:hypothetical protein